MSYVELPEPKIKIRAHNNNLQAASIATGLNDILANIVAKRPIIEGNLSKIIEAKLADLPHPKNLKDMPIAVKRLAKAIINRELIGIETDHDCDGQTSHAVIYYNLINHFKHPKQLIKSYIGHRLTEGYGLSEPLTKRILQDTIRVSLLITADNGSSDEPRIATLKAHGIDVIVTDHHQIPINNYPSSAYAFINPSRIDCNYDPYIAGCMVAWLLMVSTRIELIEQNYLPKNSPKLFDTLDYVAVGTVADCVSFAKSHINRAVVRFGLKLINKSIKHCWQALLTPKFSTIYSNLHPKKITELQVEDLGFKIGPLLNSDGRLATAFGSVSFLLAENLIDAYSWLEHLTNQNKLRRDLQRSITAQAIAVAKEQFDLGKGSICILLPEGHVGIHGISASRIKDYFGRPTVIFSPKLPIETTDIATVTNSTTVIVGSIRGIANFHVKEALEYVANVAPNLLIAFGGHEGAGGLTLKLENFKVFANLFEQATIYQLNIKQLDIKHLGPVIWSDGTLPADAINFNLINDLKVLEPYGKDFEAPIFHNTAIIKQIKFIGNGTHARMQLNIDGKILNGVWFNMKQSINSPDMFKLNDSVVCAFSVIENNFNDCKNCELLIIGMEKLI